jgi:hypothetical protein
LLNELLCRQYPTKINRQYRKGSIRNERRMRVRVLLKLIFGLFRSMTEKGSMRRWSVVGEKKTDVPCHACSCVVEVDIRLI